MRKVSQIHWTKEENKELIKLIKKHPNNLNVAFMAFAEKYSHRTKDAARLHWYNRLRKDTACFVLVGDKAIINSKGNSKKHKWVVKRNLLRRIVKLLFK